jgi:hypothetical protein
VATATEVAATKNMTVSSADTYQVTVHAPPGMDEAAVARLVRQELERHATAQRGAARAALYDAPQ